MSEEENKVYQNCSVCGTPIDITASGLGYDDLEGRSVRCAVDPDDPFADPHTWE